MIWHAIDTEDDSQLIEHADILKGDGDSSTIASRLLILEDLCPRAVEVLGSNFDIDPRVFI